MRQEVDAAAALDRKEGRKRETDNGVCVPVSRDEEELGEGENKPIFLASHHTLSTLGVGFLGRLL